ncbi:unnamed protein product [Urochloa humidicola]
MIDDFKCFGADVMNPENNWRGKLSFSRSSSHLIQFMSNSLLQPIVISKGKQSSPGCLFFSELSVSPMPVKFIFIFLKYNLGTLVVFILLWVIGPRCNKLMNLSWKHMTAMVDGVRL